MPTVFSTLEIQCRSWRQWMQPGCYEWQMFAVAGKLIPCFCTLVADDGTEMLMSWSLHSCFCGSESQCLDSGTRGELETWQSPGRHCLINDSTVRTRCSEGFCINWILSTLSMTGAEGTLWWGNSGNRGAMGWMAGPKPQPQCLWVPPDCERVFANIMKCLMEKSSKVLLWS